MERLADNSYNTLEGKAEDPKSPLEQPKSTQTLTEAIASLNDEKITGRYGKTYDIVIVSGSGITSIYIYDADDRSRYGSIPELRDLGDTLYQAGMAEFMMVHRRGLYKSLMLKISAAVPPGTKYRSSIANPADQAALIKFVEQTSDPLDIRQALKKTCFGHVLLASEFNEVQLFYNNQNDTLAGLTALQSFYNDRLNGIFSSSHNTDLFLVATKML